MQYACSSYGCIEAKKNESCANKSVDLQCKPDRLSMPQTSVLEVTKLLVLVLLLLVRYGSDGGAWRVWKRVAVVC